jgi:hypothetical protein
MAFLLALLDATPLGILTALVGYSAASTLGTLPLPPTLVGLLVGVAMLVGGTAVSLSLQREDRRFPLLWGTVDLLGLP